MSILEAPRRAPGVGEDLTERELQVLRVIALGDKESVGGSRLRPPVSANTFKTHTQHVFIKLGALNRPHAVYRGFQLGWLVLQHEPPQHPFPVLRPEGRQLLYLIAHGLTSRQIADELMCSEESVKNQIGRLYIRLGADSRADAVRIGCLGGNLHIPAVPRRIPAHIFRPYFSRSSPS